MGLPSTFPPRALDVLLAECGSDPDLPPTLAAAVAARGEEARRALRSLLAEPLVPSEVALAAWRALSQSGEPVDPSVALRVLAVLVHYQESDTAVLAFADGTGRIVGGSKKVRHRTRQDGDKARIRSVVEAAQRALATERTEREWQRPFASDRVEAVITIFTVAGSIVAHWSREYSADSVTPIHLAAGGLFDASDA